MNPPAYHRPEKLPTRPFLPDNERQRFRVTFWALEDPSIQMNLDDLGVMHPKLRGHPVSLAKLAVLALRRAGHTPPIQIWTDNDGRTALGNIAWRSQHMHVLEMLDRKRVTEEGAEAVALAYVHVTQGWIVKRRLQQDEGAHWLLTNNGRELALEVSGMESRNFTGRLALKKLQMLAQCSLRTERLAVVVEFEGPLIVVGAP